MPRVLLADDSTHAQRMGSKILTAEGIDVTTASNGEAAIKKLTDGVFDLVLADVYMPGQDGYEICQWVKNSAKHAHIPVVLVVGALELYEPEKVEMAQADGLLKKPFEASAMMETVRPLLEAVKKAKAAAPPPPPPPEPEPAKSVTPPQDRTQRLTAEDRAAAIAPAVAEAPAMAEPEPAVASSDLPAFEVAAPPSARAEVATAEFMIPEIQTEDDGPPPLADLALGESAPPVPMPEPEPFPAPVPPIPSPDPAPPEPATEPEPPVPPIPPMPRWVAEPAEVTAIDRAKFGDSAPTKPLQGDTPPDWSELLKSVEDQGPAASSTPAPAATTAAAGGDFELDLAEETAAATAAPAATAAAPSPQIKIDEETLRSAVQLCLENAMPSLIDEITSSVLRRLGRPSS